MSSFLEIGQNLVKNGPLGFDGQESSMLPVKFHRNPPVGYDEDF